MFLLCATSALESLSSMHIFIYGFPWFNTDSADSHVAVGKSAPTVGKHTDADPVNKQINNRQHLLPESVATILLTFPPITRHWLPISSC